MANPFEKYVPQQQQGTTNINPFDKYLPEELRKSKFNVTTDGGINQALQSSENKEDINPFLKYVPQQKLGSTSLWEDISFAFRLGFKDTYRGVKQMSGIDKEELKKEQQELYRKMQGENGGWIAAAYFGGAILDPAGWLIPLAKTKTLYQLAKYGFVTSGFAGALGYVDEDSVLDTRAKQAAASAVGGTVISPVLGGLVGLARGKKIPLGIPGTASAEKNIKDLNASVLEKVKLQNEAGEADRIFKTRKQIEIEESELVNDVPVDRSQLLRGPRRFFQEFVVEPYQEKIGRPTFNYLTNGEYGAETATGLVGGLYGVSTTDDDAPITTKLGRAAMGFATGFGGIRAAKKYQVTKTFVKGEKEFTESLSETLGRNFIDNYKLPKEFTKLQAEAQGHSNHIASRFINLAKKVKNNLTPDESRILYNMLEGDTRYTVSSDTLKKLSKEARDLITEIAQEYVDVGLITKETFKRNKETYLKRSYVDYTESGKYGEELRARGAIQTVTKNDYLRIYKKQKAYTTTGLEQDPIGLFKLVQGKKTLLKGHRGWELLGTSEKQFNKLKGTDEVQIRWEYTKPQRVGLGEIEDASFALAETGKAFSTTLTRFKFYDSISKIDSIAFTKPTALERQQYKLIKMPDSFIEGTDKKVYGNLAGKYVPEEVYKNLTSAEAHLKRTSNSLYEKYRKLNSIWKVSKTAWNPTVHTNNTMSNFILLDLVDGNFKDLIPSFKALMKHGKGKQRSELVELAQKNGLFDADYVNVELKNIQATSLNFPYKFNEKTDTFNNSVNAASSIFKDLKTNNILNSATQLYRFEDSVFRLALFMDRLRKGFTPAEAALDGRKSFIDYNINAPAIDWMRNSITPFIAYTYRIVPILAETAIVRPWKYAKYMALGYSLNKLGEIMGGGDQEAERAAMAERKSGRIFGIYPMPYRNIKLPEVRTDPDKPFIGPRYIDITRFIPGGDILDLGTPGIPGLPAPLQPSFGLAGDIAFPLMGYDIFRGRKIPGQTGIGAEDMGIRLDTIREKLVPNIPFIPGSYSTIRMEKARSEMQSPFKAKETELGALFNALGFKIERVDLQKLRASKIMEMERKLRGYQEQITNFTKQYSSGLINRDTLRKKIEDRKNKIKDLAEKYKVKVSTQSEEGSREPFTIDINKLTNPFIK
jgi:hypothetical protein